MTIKAEQSTMESKHDQFVKQFVDETGVSPVTATIIWHLKQAYRLLHEDDSWLVYREFTSFESWEIDYAFKSFASALPPLEGTLAAEEEWKKSLEDLKKNLEAEKKRQNSEGVGE